MLCSPLKLHTPISRALPPGLQVYLQVSPSSGSSNLFLSGSFHRISSHAASGCTGVPWCIFAGSPGEATACSILRPPPCLSAAACRYPRATSPGFCSESVDQHFLLLPERSLQKPCSFLQRGKPKYKKTSRRRGGRVCLMKHRPANPSP